VGNDPVQTRTVRAAARARLAHYALRSDAQAGDNLAALDQSVAELRELGAPARAELSKVLQLVGDLAFNRGEFANLEPLSGEVVALARNADNTPSSDLLMALVYRSGILRATGQIPLALEAAEEATAVMETLDDEVTDYMRLLVEQKYGAALSATGRARDAAPRLRSALQKAIALRGENSTVSKGLIWDLAMTQTELGQHAEAVVHYRTLLTYANEDKTANVYALHNALGRALRATGDATGASLELAQAESSACAAPSMTLPCAIIKLNLADAEQVQQHLANSQRLLTETKTFMMETGGRAAMRWHLLAARQAIAEKDSGRATQALSDSRTVWNDPAQITPLDRIVWLQADAKLGQLRGELAAARKALEDAAQLCRQHRPEDVLLQQEISDAIAQLH
jgi:tetratricopeptide (TPR) repeat protein